MTHSKSITLFLILTLIYTCGCHRSSKYSRDSFVGAWREARHGDDNLFDEKYAMNLSLNDDNTCKYTNHWNSSTFSGKWHIVDMDTSTLLIMENNVQLNSTEDYESYRHESYDRDYRRYYIFKVNAVSKGKLYLVDASTTDAYAAFKEHLFKPQE